MRARGHFSTEDGISLGHIIEHRVQPSVAVGEGRLGGDHAEDVAGHHARVAQRFLQPAQQRPVAAEGRRLLQTRQVKGLAGAGHGDGAHARLRGQVQNRNECPGSVDEVLVDLIGENERIVAGKHGEQRL